jgi:hypothetical protein
VRYTVTTKTKYKELKMNKNTITPAQAFKAILLTTIIGTALTTVSAKAYDGSLNAECDSIHKIGEELIESRTNYVRLGYKEILLADKSISNKLYHNAELVNADFNIVKREFNACNEGREYFLDLNSLNSFNGTVDTLEEIYANQPYLLD